MIYQKHLCCYRGSSLVRRGSLCVREQLLPPLMVKIVFWGQTMSCPLFLMKCSLQVQVQLPFSYFSSPTGPIYQDNFSRTRYWILCDSEVTIAGTVIAKLGSASISFWNHRACFDQKFPIMPVMVVRKKGDR